MAKRKPDKLIEYRFSLQDKERQMLDQFVAAHSFNSIVTPVVNLMNDVTGMITFFTLIAALGLTGISFKFFPDDNASLEGVVDSFFTQREQQAVAQGLAVGELTTSNPLFRLLRQWGGFEL